MNGRKMINNIDLYPTQNPGQLGDFGAIADPRRRGYDATRFLRKAMNRVALALAVVAMLPVFACHHASVVQAQSDPLNNAYKPAVDCTPADYPSNIALSGPLVKLLQDSGSPGGVYGASPCITVMATQNEFADFQVHVQAPSGGYSALNVTMSALTKSTGPGNSFTIPAPSSADNEIVVYREGYIDITTPTCVDVSTCIPTRAKATGYYPDPLVPAIDPYYHQTTAAFPVSVAAGKNQSAWIDVYVPQAAVSGWYSGTVTISNGGATLATMPIVLGVWQWPTSRGGYMPSTATLKSDEFGGNSPFSLCRIAYNKTTSNCSAYPGAGGNSDLGLEFANVDLAVQLLDNRLTLAVDNLDFGPEKPSASFNGSNGFVAYEGFLETGASGGHVVGIMPGAQRGPMVMNPPCPGNCTYGTPGAGSSGQTYISQLVTNLTGKGWFASPPNGAADYLSDEPGTNCSAWATIYANAQNTRGYSTPMLPMLVTAYLSSIDGCSAAYENAVDIMVVGDTCLETNTWYACPGEPQTVTNYRSSYNTWLSGNCCSGSGPKREVWRYGACGNAGTCGNGRPAYGDGPPNMCAPWPTGTTTCLGNKLGGPTYPNWDIDGQPIANRVEEWLAFKNQETGELYYLLDGCFYNNNGCGTEPWTSQYNAGNNGDGNLIYYGSDSAHSSGVGALVNVNVPIWVPSMRIKMMRDGMQDYEYLHLLSSLGGSSAALVTTEINSWITNGYCFNVNPVAAASQTTTACSSAFTGDLTSARYALGQAMHQLTYGVSLLPPQTLTGTVQ